MAKNDKLAPETKAPETPPMKHATQVWRRKQIKRMVDRGKDFEMILINTNIPREIALPIYLELKAEQSEENTTAWQQNTMPQTHHKKDKQR